MQRHVKVFSVAIALVCICLPPVVTPLAAGAEPEKSADRPNVLWFFIDDMSANFSCYGETLIQTPHVDRLAAEGTRFSHAFVTAPVCSPCRSARSSFAVSFAL